MAGYELVVPYVMFFNGIILHANVIDPLPGPVLRLQSMKVLLDLFMDEVTEDE